jgi:hypothetical protein
MSEEKYLREVHGLMISYKYIMVLLGRKHFLILDDLCRLIEGQLPNSVSSRFFLAKSDTFRKSPKINIFNILGIPYRICSAT